MLVTILKKNISFLYILIILYIFKILICVRSSVPSGSRWISSCQRWKFPFESRTPETPSHSSPENFRNKHFKLNIMYDFHDKWKKLIINQNMKFTISSFLDLRIVRRGRYLRRTVDRNRRHKSFYRRKQWRVGHLGLKISVSSVMIERWKNGLGG